MFRIPDDKTKYSAKWHYIEIAKGTYSEATKKSSLYRIQDDDDKPIVIHVKDLPEAIKKYGDKGFYTSVWQFNSTDVENASRMSNLYFDLDHEADPSISHADSLKLLNYLKDFIPRDAIHWYFTGLKGFHIEVEALALGISPGNENHVIFRYIANDLKDNLDITTLDFSVYDARRIWRYPNTMHQKSGLYKVELFDDDMTLEAIKAYAAKPQELNTKEQVLDYKACKWYRNYSYRVEQEKIKRDVTPAEMLRRFSDHGSANVRSGSFDDKEFDPKRLLDSCKAISTLWEKAERTGHLEHEERLFLCSILSYTDEGLDYLYAILGQCHDFNPDVSRAHVDDWIRRREMGIGGKPYSCKTANEKGFGCGNCDLEVRKKWVKSGNTIIKTEEDARPSPIRFAYSRKAKGY